MDLTPSPDMLAFRHEVEGFLADHAGDFANGQPKDPKAWQQLLIEHGYAARTIPRPTAATAPSPTS